MEALDEAGGRHTGLTAAVIGAAMAKKMGLSVLQGLQGDALAKKARHLIDPRPPRVSNPLLKEAVRRASEITAGKGAFRLKRKKRAPVDTPMRGTESIGDSARAATPDAPGEDE